MLTILRAQRRGFHTELADGIREGKREVTVGHVVVIVASIQLPLGRVAAAAGNRDRDGGVRVLATGEIAAGSCCCAS